MPPAHGAGGSRARGVSADRQTGAGAPGATATHRQKQVDRGEMTSVGASVRIPESAPSLTETPGLRSTRRRTDGKAAGRGLPMREGSSTRKPAGRASCGASTAGLVEWWRGSIWGGRRTGWFAAEPGTFWPRAESGTHSRQRKGRRIARRVCHFKVSPGRTGDRTKLHSDRGRRMTVGCGHCR